MFYDIISRVQLLIERNKLDEAREKITEGLSQYPDSADLYGFLAQVHERKNEIKEALAAIETAIGLHPENDYLHFIRSRIFHLKKDYYAALLSIDESLRIDPEHADYYGMKALILLAQEKKEAAIMLARIGLEKDAGNILCMNVLSMALGSSGKAEEAESALGDLLQNDPDNAFTQANMGYTYLRKGDIQKAKEHFRAALMIDPESDYAREGMLEAAKASNFFYRKILQYYVWMEKFSEGKRWALIIGLLVIVKLLPILVPFYLIFLLWIWFAPPIANVLLYFDKFGRYLMSKETLLLTQINLGLLAVAAISAAIFAPFFSVSFLGMSFGLFSAIVPVYAIETRFKNRNKIIMGAFALLFAGLGIAGVVYSLSGENSGAMWGALLVSLFLYTWVANIFSD